VRFAYTGNVHDKAGGSTFCPACDELLIGRDWYVLSEWNIGANGSCPSCGAQVPGVFEALPGVWGPRRQPVRLADFL
jgi:pyruvate formate lyase activating enzyme